MTHVLPNALINDKSFHLTQIEELFCLRYQTATQKSTKFIRTTMHSIILLQSGEKIISFDDKKFSLKAGDIALLTQNNYYMSERVVDVAPYKVVVLYLDDAFIIDFVKRFELNLKDAISHEAIMIKKHDLLFDDNIALLEAYIDKGLPSSLLKLKIEELLLFLLHSHKERTLSFLRAIVATSKDRIDYILKSNIDLLFTVEDMCSMTRLSNAQLRDYIKTKHHSTPKSWLDTQRLQKAEMMLQNTDKSIKEISTECGYATQSWFIAQFKKYYNCTPKEFRHKL